MNLLRPEDYYTQRNNRYSPFESCMNTSRVMFYKAAGIEYHNPTALADDDYFFSLLNTDEAITFCKEKYPNLYMYPPTQIHGMYGSWLDQKITGERRSNFKTNLTWEDFVNEVKNGRPVMTSGTFPGVDGHAFVFIGYDSLNEELIAADPWGNPHMGYKGSRGLRGYGVRYDKAYFNKHVKPGEYKWAHVLL